MYLWDDKSVMEADGLTAPPDVGVCRGIVERKREVFLAAYCDLLEVMLEVGNLRSGPNCVQKANGRNFKIEAT